MQDTGAPPQSRTTTKRHIAVSLLVLGGLVSLQHLQGLLDLGVQGLGTLEQVQQLGIVHLEEHARDLPGQLRLGLVDEGVQPLPDHVLLDLGRGGRERRGRELLPGGGGGSMGATAAVHGAGRGGRLLRVKWGHWHGTVAD